jgi:hypothetical protein
VNENTQIKKINGDSHACGLLGSAVSFRELEYSAYLVFFFLSSLFLKLEFFLCT